MLTPEDIGKDKQRLISDLVSDLLLVIALPLVVVLWLFWMTRGASSFNTPTAAKGMTAFLFLGMQVLAFATLYLWAIARRRSFGIQMRIQPDLITLCGYVLSSVSLVAVLQVSWTATEPNWVVVVFQVILLLAGMGFNAYVTFRTFERLRSLRSRPGEASPPSSSSSQT